RAKLNILPPVTWTLLRRSAPENSPSLASANRRLRGLSFAERPQASAVVRSITDGRCYSLERRGTQLKSIPLHFAPSASCSRSKPSTRISVAVRHFDAGAH